MGRTQYYTATSLDGFIADERHSLEWLFKQRQDRAGPLNYDTFITNIGAIVLGSTTYEWVLEHEGNWPYELPTWVFTHRRLQPASGVTFASGDVAQAHRELIAAAGERNIWVVGGGDLAGQFADAGLLDDVIVYIAAVTLGQGAPLLPRRLDLHLEETERNGDFITARYAL